MMNLASPIRFASSPCFPAPGTKRQPRRGGCMTARPLALSFATRLFKPSLGPVLVRKGGYSFDCWTPEEGLSRGYTYGRIEDARYARNVEIRTRNKGSSRGS